MPTIAPPPPIEKLTPRPPSKKPSFPEKKICYGTFRHDFPEEKKEECHTCWMYIDCIQLSFKDQRKFRAEIRRFAGHLQRRIETLSSAAADSAA